MLSASLAATASGIASEPENVHAPTVPETEKFSVPSVISKFGALSLDGWVRLKRTLGADQVSVVVPAGEAIVAEPLRLPR